MQQFLYNIRQFLARLTLGQKVSLAVVILGSVGLLLGISYWAGRPEYALLFGRLDAGDANRIVEVLNEERIPYELRDNGTAIYVPREQVYELRLRFAGEGIVSSGPAGYELFDQGTLGMTDFMQKLNMKRALEGELARTITSIRQVEVARVHLVIPERSPFRETQERPTASVVLQLAGGVRLTPAQIQGIGALVAGAVEGLDPADVTVLDTRGNMLSNPDAGNPEVVLTSSQLQMQQAIESRLVEKGQSMLDRVLGPGNAIVRVTTTLDFTRSVTERELIDPESATVISEEKLEESGEGALNANSVVRNYDLSRSRERSEKSLGEIEHMSVSVILNYKKVLAEDDPETPATYEPYSEEELQEIERLVKNAVGFQPERGDRFAIHQTRFDTSADREMAQEMRAQRQQRQIEMYVRYGLMLLSLIVAAWLLRSATRRIGTMAREGGLIQGGVLQSRQVEGREQVGALEQSSSDTKKLPSPNEEEEDMELVKDMYTSKLSAEARARLKAKHLMFEEVKKAVEDQPEETAELIRSWLAEDMAKSL